MTAESAERDPYRLDPGDVAEPPSGMRDTLRRIVACVNACAGVPTETLELCARWGDVVNATVFNRVHIPAEAAAVGAVLDGASLEQGEPL